MDSEREQEFINIIESLSLSALREAKKAVETGAEISGERVDLLIHCMGSLALRPLVGAPLPMLLPATTSVPSGFDDKLAEMMDRTTQMMDRAGIPKADEATGETIEADPFE